MTSSIYIDAMTKYAAEDSLQSGKGFNPASILHYPTAVVSDVFTSVANSLLFEESEISTESVIRTIAGNDAVEFYNNHRGAVEIGSFLTGAFIPGKIVGAIASATKGTKYLSVIDKVHNATYFNNKLKASSTAALDALKTAGEMSAEYQKAKSAMKLWRLSSGVAEAAVIEAEIYALYNGHSFFDDYGADSVFQNLALGGAIGWGVKSLTAGAEFKTAAQELQAKKFAPYKHLVDSPTNLDNLGLNLASDVSLLKEQSKVLQTQGLAPDVRDLLSASQISTQKRIRDNVLRMMSPELREASQQVNRGTNVSFLSAQNIDQMTPLEHIGHLLSQDPGALIGTGGRTFGDVVPPIRPYDVNGVFAAGRMQIETGAEILRDNAIGGRNVEALLPYFSKKATNLADDVLSKLEASGQKLPTLNIVEAEDHYAIELADGIFSRVGESYLLSKISRLPNKNKPVILSGKGLENMATRIKKARTESGALALANTDLRNKFYTPAEMSDIGISFGEAQAVVDTWSGMPRIIGHGEGRLLAGVAENPKFQIDPNFPMLGPEALRDAYVPATRAIEGSEALYVNALNAINKVPEKQTGFIFREGDLPRLQALLVGKLDKTKIRLELVDDAGKTTATITDYTALQERIIKTKLGALREMVLGPRKVPLEMAAKDTNTPYQTAKLFANGGFQYSPDYLHMIPKDFIAYADATTDGIKNVLKPKLILLDGDVKGLAAREELKSRISLDRQFLDDMQDGVTENIIRSRPEYVQDLYDNLINSPTAKELREGLDQFVGNVSTGNAFFNSRDFALRHNPLERIVSKMGVDFRHKVQAQTQKIVGNKLKPAFEELGRNPAERTQFYLINQALDSLSSGDAGQMAVVTMANGTKRIQLAPEQVLHGKVVKPATYLNYVGSTEPIAWESGTALGKAMDAISDPEVVEATLGLINTNRALQGLPAIPARAIHIPYNSIDDQFTAYLLNVDDFGAQSAKLIIGRDLKDLQAKITALQSEIDPRVQRIITSRDQLNEWNMIHSMAKLENLERANPAKVKSGIYSTVIPNDNSLLDSILGRYNEEIWSQSRALMTNSNPRLFQKLQEIQDAQQALGKSTRENLFSRIQKPKSTARLVANTLLNRSDLPDSPLFNTLNNWYSASITLAHNSVKSAVETLRDSIGPNNLPSDEQWIALNDHFKSKNIPIPWKDKAEALMATSKAYKDVSQTDIAKASSVLVTLNLRLFDLSQVMVNTLSAPLMMSAETGQGLFASMKSMHQGAKMLFNPSTADDALVKGWKAKGYITRQVAETTDLMRDLHIRMPLMDKLEQQKLWQWMVKPADWSEEMVRSLAFSTGYKMAKAKFPNATQDALEAWAMQFTNRSIGNYISRQRPTMFQGSLGATMGLYQTFTLTMAQNIFRHIESADRKALLKLFGGWQAGFGLGAMPLYQPINHMIGAAAAIPGDDITSAVYEAFGDSSDQSRSLAEFIMYGLPSAAFQIPLNQRAELQPRLPLSSENGVLGFSPALINASYSFINDTMSAAGKIGAIASNGGGMLDMGRAVFEGLSAQYLWRPGARMAEILMGRSIDRTGATVSASDEVYEPWAILARVAASRPLKEQVLRNMRFHDRYYDALERESRRKTVQAMRSMAVDGISPASTAALLKSYITDGGSVRGFNQALNQAYLTVDQPFADKLVDDLDNNGPIADIIRSYAF